MRMKEDRNGLTCNLQNLYRNVEMEIVGKRIVRTRQIDKDTWICIVNDHLKKKMLWTTDGMECEKLV